MILAELEPYADEFEFEDFTFDIDNHFSKLTVVYTDKTHTIMKELGYDCKQFSFDELESRCAELKQLYMKLASGT